jgi:hypothetical protein
MWGGKPGGPGCAALRRLIDKVLGKTGLLTCSADRSGGSVHGHHRFDPCTATVPERRTAANPRQASTANGTAANGGVRWRRCPVDPASVLPVLAGEHGHARAVRARARREGTLGFAAVAAWLNGLNRERERAGQRYRTYESSDPSDHCLAFLSNLQAGLTSDSATLAGRPFTDLTLVLSQDGVRVHAQATGWSNPVAGQGLAVARRDARVLTDLLLHSDDWSGHRAWCVPAGAHGTHGTPANGDRPARPLHRIRHSRPSRRRARMNQLLGHRPEMGAALNAIYQGPWRLPPTAYAPTSSPLSHWPDTAAMTAAPAVRIKPGIARCEFTTAIVLRGRGDGIPTTTPKPSAGTTKATWPRSPKPAAPPATSTTLTAN